MRRTINTYYIISLLVLTFFVVACKKENNSSETFIHNVYNDTFKINVIYGTAPLFQDTTKIDTINYDINNDNIDDIIGIYSRIKHSNTTSFRIGSLINNYFAYYTSYLPFYYFKTYKLNDIIKLDDFLNESQESKEIFNSNPAGEIYKFDTDKADTTDNTFYIACMDSSFNSTKHHYTWFKFRLQIDVSNNIKNLILLESIYNTIPLEALKIEEY
ncbi:MAG: hypothetical protein U0T77_09655 [Chitinophagales bacterium]